MDANPMSQRGFIDRAGFEHIVINNMNTPAIREETVFEVNMNAVLIYDTIDFAAMAKIMLERVARATEETMQWSIKPWRVDILKLPQAAETALTEAVGAHLILLALRQVQSLASWLVEWLERWARGREVLEAALAVWDGGTAGTTSAGATRELLRFAGRHGLSLILDESTTAEKKGSILASDLHNGEVSSRPAARRIHELRPWDPYRHWGIND
jgi:hypothetical protein